jgi:hypothetical protein
VKISTLKIGQIPSNNGLNCSINFLLNAGLIKQQIKNEPFLLTFDEGWLIIFGTGEVLELADRHDLGSCAARRAGSSPAFPTTIFGG